MFEHSKQNTKLNQTDLVGMPIKPKYHQRILNQSNAKKQEPLKTRDSYERAPILSYVYGHELARIKK